MLLACAGVLLFEPNAPLVLHELAMLLALVPVVRMLPPGVRARYGAWPIVAAGLYLFARGNFLLSADALYYRAMVACQQGQFADGVEFARKAVAAPGRRPSIQLID